MSNNSINLLLRVCKKYISLVFNIYLEDSYSTYKTTFLTESSLNSEKEASLLISTD